MEKKGNLSQLKSEVVEPYKWKMLTLSLRYIILIPKVFTLSYLHTMVNHFQLYNITRINCLFWKFFFCVPPKHLLREREDPPLTRVEFSSSFKKMASRFSSLNSHPHTAIPEVDIHSRMNSRSFYWTVREGRLKKVIDHLADLLTMRRGKIFSRYFLVHVWHRWPST